MSGDVFLDRHRLAAAFSEIELVRKALPAAALTVLAKEVVKRVAVNLHALHPVVILPTSEDIDALCAALFAPDEAAAITLIEQAQRNGASHDDLYRFYLAEAAKRLGTWWEDDKVSFVHVTIAAGRIYAILRILRLQKHLPAADLRRAALFAGVPGEDHTLGITIAADMARDRGWDIELLVGRTHDELVQVMTERATALIGLSVSTRRSLPAVLKLIVALRIGKPKARILVCGPGVTAEMGLNGLMGADATASDFDTALTQMDRLLTPSLV